MKVSGSRIKSKVLEPKNSQTAASTRETTFKGDPQELALTSGPAENDTTGSG